MLTPSLGLLRILRYPPYPGTFDGTRYGAGTHTDYGNYSIAFFGDPTREALVAWYDATYATALADGNG